MLLQKGSKVENASIDEHDLKKSSRGKTSSVDEATTTFQLTQLTKQVVKPPKNLSNLKMSHISAPFSSLPTSTESNQSLVCETRDQDVDSIEKSQSNSDKLVDDSEYGDDEALNVESALDEESIKLLSKGLLCLIF